MNKPDKITITLTARDCVIAASAGAKVLCETVADYENNQLEFVGGDNLFDTLPVDIAATLDDMDVPLADIVASLRAHGGAA